MTENNKNNSKLGLAILITVLIIGVVSGGTYAYWSWTSTNAQKTNVVFRVESPDITAPVWSGDSTISSGTLEPVSSCSSTTTSKCLRTPIRLTYQNTTTETMYVKLNLYLTSFTLRDSAYQPTSTDLSKLHWRLTTSSTSTATKSTTNISYLTPNTSYKGSASYTNDTNFKGLSFTSGSTTPTELSTKPVELATLSIPVAAGANSSTNYNLFVWLDDSYSFTNIGDENTDPMQGLSFELQWGILSNGVIGPGTYGQEY